jgi:O-antigen/teichoic acid export membrane protein
MEWEAALIVTTNVATVAASLVLLILYPAPWALLAGYAAGSGIGLALALWALRNYLKKTFSHFDRTLIAPLSEQALPLALGALLGGTMLTVDTIMLGFWRTAGEIGLYSAAQKPIQLAYSLAGIVNIALFPALSRLYSADNGKFKKTLKKVLAWSAALGAALTLIGAAFPELIMSLIYGAEYAAAAQTFRILCFTLVINAPIVIGVSALIAANKQNAFLWSAPIGAISNAGLNALLIPQWGAEGAAASTLITQIIMNGYLWIKIRKLYL